jgi:hypothetical protein
MIVELSPKYKFVCERCGKEKFPDGEHGISGIYEVAFEDRSMLRERDIKKGSICEECFAEFCELANNFFDEVNKEKKE